MTAGAPEGPFTTGRGGGGGGGECREGRKGESEGRSSPRRGGGNDKGCARAGGEQTVHIIAPSSGMEGEGAEKRSENNEKQRRKEWRCSWG